MGVAEHGAAAHDVAAQRRTLDAASIFGGTALATAVHGRHGETGSDVAQFFIETDGGLPRV